MTFESHSLSIQKRAGAFGPARTEGEMREMFVA